MTQCSLNPPDFQLRAVYGYDGDDLIVDRGPSVVPDLQPNAVVHALCKIASAYIHCRLCVLSGTLGDQRGRTGPVVG